MTRLRRVLDALEGCWFWHEPKLTENGHELYWKCAICGLRAPDGIPHNTSRLHFIKPTPAPTPEAKVLAFPRSA